MTALAVRSPVRIAAGFLVVALAGSACTHGAGGSATGQATPASPSPGETAAGHSIPAPTPSSASSTQPEPEFEFLPDPDRPVPDDAAAVADELQLVSDALDASIQDWLSAGDPTKRRVPLGVRLQALYQQRLYRALVADPTLADRTIDGLSKGLATAARATVDAGASILSIVHAVPSASVVQTQRPPAAGDLVEWFREAGSRFGVDWELLAAVMFVESKFGRVRSASSDGAQGPMQFLPSTWAAYGLGGDIHDPHDAILAAANYLHASGAPEQERAALHAYNHSWAYVDAIEGYAGRMRADPLAFYAFYNWQVFVLTTKGAVRLTGPGL